MTPRMTIAKQPVRAWLAAQLRDTAETHVKLADDQLESIERAGDLLAKALRAGHKVIWFGNGGSATQSQHMAAEFVGRFQKDRRSLPSISLTENMASVTAIGNDYAFEQIFSRQLEGLGQSGMWWWGSPPPAPPRMCSRASPSPGS